MQNLKKRLPALALTLILALSLLPTGAVAYVGAMSDNFTVSNAYEYGDHYAIENDYIYMGVNTTSPDIYLSPKDPNGGAIAREVISLEFFVDYPGQEKREMVFQAAEQFSTEEALTGGVIHAVYTFADDHYQTPGDMDITYTVDFRLVCLDEGGSSGNTEDPLLKVEGDAGTTWGVFVDGEFSWDGSMDEDDRPWDELDPTTVSVRANFVYFSSLGHSEYDREVPQAPVMISKAHGSTSTGTSTAPPTSARGWTGRRPTVKTPITRSLRCLWTATPTPIPSWPPHSSITILNRHSAPAA